LAAVDKPRAHSSVRRGAGRPYLVFLAPPGAGEGGDKAARIARAIGDAGGLTAVSLEPEWVEQSERGVVAHWPPDAFGNGWRANRPDLIACLGVGSIATVPRSPFDGLAGAGTGPQGERRVRETFNSWSVRVLERARADGICVNYEPSFFQMGNKSVLERRCRHFESQGGRTVLRPRTWVVAPGGEGSLRRDLGNAGPGPLIVKPAEGAQGYGLRFASHPDDLPDVTTESVVQEVVRDPLTLDGHKIDIRAYLVVRCGPEEAYRVASFMMIRRAVARYEVGTPTAEITNIAYARRRGQVVNAVPLDALAASVDTGSVRRAVKATLRQLCAMLAMYAPPAGFAAVWGVDLALSRHEGQLQALLLEVNTAPEIYRGDGALDAETDLMLTTEVGPWLREHLAARRVDVASARRVSPAGPRPAPRP
jgi:hypothetical protein